MEKPTKKKLNSMSSEEKDQLILSLLQENEQLSDQLSRLRMQMFGRRSEKTPEEADERQLKFVFNEAEAAAGDEALQEEPEDEETSEEEPAKAEPKKSRKKKGRRKPDFSRMPEEVIEHTLSEEDQKELLGSHVRELKPQVHDEIIAVPAKMIHVKHIIHVYAGDNDRIIKADHPNWLIPYTFASPSLAAGIMNAKYVNQVPLNRLSEEFHRAGFHLTRQTMAKWMIHLTDKYLYLLTDRLKTELLSHHIIHADETPVLVNRDGRKAGSKSYMWVYRSNVNDDHPVILFDYHKTRKTDCLREFVNGFHGVIVSDGYASYHQLEKEMPESITSAGCWVHVRRNFFDIIKAAGGKDRKKAKYTLAEEGVRRIAEITHRDKELLKIPEEKRKEEDVQALREATESFFAWAQKHLEEVPGGSNIGKAFKYALNRKKSLEVFLDDLNVPINNNAAERALRPFCVGKHSWHMIDTVRGAQSSAALYSIAETAKANGLFPFEYYKYLLEVIPQHMDDTNLDFLNELLPWSEEVQKRCLAKDEREKADNQ